MPKILFALLVVVTLAGAGCAQGTSDQTAEENSGESVPVTIEVTTEDGTVVSGESGSTATDENGVPITEIILGEAADVTVNMEAVNFSFSPNTITASPGDEVQVNFTKNTGFHTFVIDEIDVSFAIEQGETLIFTAPDEPGEYAFYCDIGSHRSMGMEGVLIVE